MNHDKETRAEISERMIEVHRQRRLERAQSQDAFKAELAAEGIQYVGGWYRGDYKGQFTPRCLTIAECRNELAKLRGE